MMLANVFDDCDLVRPATLCRAKSSGRLRISKPLRNVVQAKTQRQYMCMPDRPPVSQQELREQGCWRADDAVRAAAAQPIGGAAAGTA